MTSAIARKFYESGDICWPGHQFFRAGLDFLKRNTRVFFKSLNHQFSNLFIFYFFCLISGFWWQKSRKIAVVPPFYLAVESRSKQNLWTFYNSPSLHLSVQVALLWAYGFIVYRCIINGSNKRKKSVHIHKLYIIANLPLI